MTRRRRAPVAIVAALPLLTPAWTHAQGLAGRVALEAVAAASSSARAMDDPSIILDLVGTVRLADGLDIVVRPWSRRSPGGDWMFEMYQLQLRYVSPTRVPFRVDAGIIPSPVGLFTLELQPHRNPLIGAPFYYFAPLPAIDDSPDRVRLISGGYPLGAVFTVSGSRWDARAGVTDSSPARPHNVLGRSRPPARPQLVLGAGVTPVTGMRLGFGMAHGRYRPGVVTPSGSTIGPLNATVFNVEGEYAFGHTRISGEWIHDRFETLAGPAPGQPSGRGTAVARGFNVQAAQTLSPRVFTAARATRVSSPVAPLPAALRRASTALEATIGYRLSPEMTVRGGYQRERGYYAGRWSHAAVLSVVWAERWW